MVSEENPGNSVRGATYTFGDNQAMQRCFDERTLEADSQYLLQFLRDEMTILDCGCGTGSITVGMAKAAPGSRIVGIDTSQRTGPIPANGDRRSRPDRVIWKRASVRPIKSAVRWNGKVRKWLTTLDKSGPNT